MCGQAACRSTSTSPTWQASRRYARCSLLRLRLSLSLYWRGLPAPVAYPHLCLRCMCMAPHVDVSPHAPQPIVSKGFSLADWAAAVRDAGALDERHQRRLARRQPPRHAGVHDRCVAQPVRERHQPLLPHPCCLTSPSLPLLPHLALAPLARLLSLVELRSAAPAMHGRAARRASYHALDP
jgi:hypothetical protein